MVCRHSNRGKTCHDWDHLLSLKAAELIIIRQDKTHYNLGLCIHDKAVSLDSIRLSACRRREKYILHTWGH